MRRTIRKAENRKIVVKKNIMKMRKSRRAKKDSPNLMISFLPLKVFDRSTLLILFIILVLLVFIVKELFLFNSKELSFENRDNSLEYVLRNGKDILIVAPHSFADNNFSKDFVLSLSEEIAVTTFFESNKKILEEQNNDVEISGFIFEDFADASVVVDREVSEEEMAISRDSDIIPDKAAAWRKYQVAVNRNMVKDKPVISIIIDDVGLNVKRAEMVIDIKGPITLSFLPYGRKLKELSLKARENGHEVMLHAPMEPLGDYDPGPGALMTDMSEAEIKSATLAMFDKLDGYVGANNHMGSKFTTDRKLMKAFLKVIKEKDLMFVDSKTLNGSVGDKMSEEMDIATAARDVFLDHVISEEESLRRLKQLETKAIKYGSAIGIGHPHKTTITALKKWIPTLKDKGIEIVPITYVIEINRIRTLAKREGKHKLSLKEDKKSGKDKF